MHPRHSVSSGFVPLEVSHNSLELLISIPRCDVNAAHSAVQAAWRHQILVPDFLFSPSLHRHPSLSDLFDASNLTTLQADLDPMVVNGGFSQNVFHDTLSECAGTLILL